MAKEPNDAKTSGRMPGSGVAERPAASEETAFPKPVLGCGNFDEAAPKDFRIEFVERDLIEKIDERVAANQYELPHLSTTHMRLLDLTSSSEPDVTKVEKLIAPDVALTAALLKVANSVMYGGARQVDTVRGAILRIGIRGLRSALFSLSLRSVIFKGKGLAQLAEEVWRQAFALGTNARAAAQPLGLDAEKMFVLGLLADLGKVPLLHMLRDLAPARFDFRRPFVGYIFARHHEPVGQRLAGEWNLPEDVVAVAGCHHDYAKNATHLRAAALVHLAHRLDVHLSTGDAKGYAAMEQDKVMDALAAPPLQRRALLESVKAAYLRAAGVAMN